MDEVCQSLARWVFLQVPLDLRLDTCFPFIHMPFKEDSIDTLGKVGRVVRAVLACLGKSRWGSWVHIWQWSNFLWDLGSVLVA